MRKSNWIKGVITVSTESVLCQKKGKKTEAADEGIRREDVAGRRKKQTQETQDEMYKQRMKSGSSSMTARQEERIESKSGEWVGAP